MSRVLVWDLPIRLFHWLLVIGLLAAFAIAQFGGEHGPLFPYHAMIGLVLAGMVLLRLIWGVVGSRHARFSSFLFSPGAVINYLKSLRPGSESVHYAGHNPASSYAIFAMLALVLLIAGSGLAKAYGVDGVGEIHTPAVYILLVIAGIHVIGVVLHTLRHKENIALSMITGRKHAESTAAIRSVSPFIAALFLVLVVLLGGTLYKNYQVQTGTTSLLSARIPLGEMESKAAKKPRHRDHDED